MSNVIRLQKTRVPVAPISDVQMMRDLDHLLQGYAQWMVIRLAMSSDRNVRSLIRKNFKAIQSYRKRELSSLFAYDVCHSQPVGDNHVR